MFPISFCIIYVILLFLLIMLSSMSQRFVYTTFHLFPLRDGIKTEFIFNVIGKLDKIRDKITEHLIVDDEDEHSHSNINNKNGKCQEQIRIISSSLTMEQEMKGEIELAEMKEVESGIDDATEMFLENILNEVENNNVGVEEKEFIV